MRGKSLADLNDVPYSSVQQREYFVSAHMSSKDMGGNFPSTPDLVHSLNQLQHTSLPPIESALKYTCKDTTKSAKRRLCLLGQLLPFAFLTRWFAEQPCARARPPAGFHRSARKNPAYKG